MYIRERIEIDDTKLMIYNYDNYNEGYCILTSSQYSLSNEHAWQGRKLLKRESKSIQIKKESK